MPLKTVKPARIVRLLLVEAIFSASMWAIACCAPSNVFAANECRARGTSNPDCGQHNMMMVGQQNVFASHLPMFRSVHRFQVILEVELAKGGESLNSVYIKDRKEHPGERMYTVEPSELFVLARLFSGDDTTRRKSFRGTVFRGHLEREGTPLDELTSIDVNVLRVVYAEEIGPPRGPDRESELTYILFGKGSEMFLAHRITQPPDFDQLLSVKVAGHAFTEEELNRGVLVTAPDRPNKPTRRLRPGETVAVTAHVEGAHAFMSLKVAVNAEPYFEEGELATEFTQTPTPLEIEAGFGDKP